MVQQHQQQQQHQQLHEGQGQEQGQGQEVHVDDRRSTKDSSAEASFFRSYAVVAVLQLGLSFLWGISSYFIMVSTAGVVAVDFMGESFGTIPIGLLLGLSTVAAFLIPKINARIGYRISYSIGISIGIVGGVLNIIATRERSFTMLCIGTMLQGVPYAYSYNLRFLVLSFAPAKYANRAVSLVVAGGAIAAIGPQLSLSTKNSLPDEYMGSFVSSTSLLAAFLLTFNTVCFSKQLNTASPRCDDDAPLNSLQVEGEAQQAANTVGQLVAIDSDHRYDDSVQSARVAQAQRPAADIDTNSSQLSASPPQILSGDVLLNGSADDVVPRTNWQLLRQPTFAAACAVMAISFSGMSGLMNATPLHMKALNFPFSTTTFALQLHIMIMYLPSLVTGDAITRFGIFPVMYTGLISFVVGICVFYGGQTRSLFVVGLFLNGFGWNLAFVSATRLLTTAFLPCEKARATGLNDAIMLASLTVLVMVASRSLTDLGWWLFLHFYMVYFAVALVVVLVPYHVFIRRSGRKHLSSRETLQHVQRQHLPPASQHVLVRDSATSWHLEQATDHGHVRASNEANPVTAARSSNGRTSVDCFIGYSIV